MAGSSDVLSALCACLRCDVPSPPDWKALLALANQTMTTTALIEFVRSRRADVPDDVAAYVEELHRRNAIRTGRLRGQLEEAVMALNSAGIVPILLKGAAMLATSAASDCALRLMSDLDILVSSDEIDLAMASLAAIGYRIDELSDGPKTKWFADLKRPLDVGMIDLHGSFPAGALLDQTTDELRVHLRSISFGGASALVPSPELQVLLIVLHDQFQDHDYWTGSLDLRHLLDLRAIVTRPGGVEWGGLMAMASCALVRNALEAQLLLLTKLFDVGWLDGNPKRALPRLLVWRQLLQARHPGLRCLFLPLGLLELRSHRRRQESLRFGSQFSGDIRQRWLPRFGTLLFLLSLSRRSRAGKL